jgi:hypothetical protein
MHAARLAGLFLACTISTTAPASAEIYTHRAFLTGGAFLALSPSERLLYETGVVEGVLSAPYLGSPLPRAARLDRCLHGMSNAEVTDMLTAYLDKHADERQYEMPTVTLRALDARCGRD